MVCIFCGQQTSVTNSRFNKKQNRTWRRRQCTTCHKVFTTHELIDLAGSITVQAKNKTLTPFSRDKLLVSLYKSCAHRPTAAEDAAALTNTVIAYIFKQKSGQVASVPIVSIRKATYETLKRFDRAAATHYAAYHP